MDQLRISRITGRISGIRPYRISGSAIRYLAGYRISGASLVFILLDKISNYSERICQ
jgi:hypothetical protein